uniref:Transmembrane protein 79-like n=1 Tax=Gouania willdenowi TaxID=441366 RepID=A0A8C5D3X8_GOUWI
NLIQKFRILEDKKQTEGEGRKKEREGRKSTEILNNHHCSRAPCLQHSSVSQSEEPRVDPTEEGKLDQTLSIPITTAHSLDTATENCIGPPTPTSQGDIPNGTDSPRWNPESTNLDSTVDEGRPLISPPLENVELTVWSPEERVDTCEAVEGVSDPGHCCCHCCQCNSCPSGRVPAFLSVLASLLCSVGILYALYFYVPIRPPDCPDLSSRIVFTLCCCMLATLPILLAMLVGAACMFCHGSFQLQESPPSRWAVQQLFLTASTQQLLLYVLNLVVMAALLPPDQLKLVPILVAMFILGRLVYWASLNMCSSWRGFGSGLSVFPLLALVSLNLFLMYKRNLTEPLFSGSQDVLYNQVTTSSWSGETSQSPNGKPDVQPTDILDAQ